MRRVRIGPSTHRVAPLVLLAGLVGSTNALAGVTSSTQRANCFDAGVGGWPTAASEDDLEANTGGDADCWELTVECPLTGIGTRTAVVKINTPSATPIGNVMLTNGGPGTGYYHAGDSDKNDTVEALVLAGFKTYEIKWDAPDGFLTDSFGAGENNLMCGTNAIATWLKNNHFEPNVANCATGNSSGGVQFAMMLSSYGAGPHLRMVVMTGGPSISSMYDICFDAIHHQKPGGVVTWNEFDSGVASNSSARVIIDKIMGWYDPQPEELACSLDNDNDSDGFVNDGCPQVGVFMETGAECANDTSDDLEADGAVNDGCPTVDPVNWCQSYRVSGTTNYLTLPPSGDLEFMDGTSLVSTGAAAEARNYNPATDQYIVVAENDVTGAHIQAELYHSQLTSPPPIVYLPSAETGAQCLNDTSDDEDPAWVNDGCPAMNAPETGDECGNAIDDDPIDDGGGNSRINDGCPSVGAHEIDERPEGAAEIQALIESYCHLAESSCTDGLDNDGDGDLDCNDSDCTSDPAC